jgi:hypothetical protein
VLPVQSSNVAAVGWEPGPAPWSGTLTIEFTRGAVYRYTGVPAVVAFLVAKGALDGSVGHTFHVLVRKVDYPYERIK